MPLHTHKHTKNQYTCNLYLCIHVSTNQLLNIKRTNLHSYYKNISENFTIFLTSSFYYIVRPSQKRVPKKCRLDLNETSLSMVMHDSISLFSIFMIAATNYLNCHEIGRHIRRSRTLQASFSLERVMM